MGARGMDGQNTTFLCPPLTVGGVEHNKNISSIISNIFSSCRMSLSSEEECSSSW